jgi:hypothetical protein
MDAVEPAALPPILDPAEDRLRHERKETVRAEPVEALLFFGCSKRRKALRQAQGERWLI